MRDRGKPAVFLDRDGTVTVEIGYMRDPSRLRLHAGAGEAIRSLRAAGFRCVLVTNQSGVSRGYFTLARVRETHARLRKLLRGKGTRLDAVYACVHSPDGGCACRKPGTGMLRSAARRLRLDLRASYVVGDKATDVELARNAHCRSVQVLTGFGRAERRRARRRGVVADHVAPTLAAASRWILADARRAA